MENELTPYTIIPEGKRENQIPKRNCRKTSTENFSSVRLQPTFSGRTDWRTDGRTVRLFLPKRSCERVIPKSRLSLEKRECETKMWHGTASVALCGYKRVQFVQSTSLGANFLFYYITQQAYIDESLIACQILAKVPTKLQPKTLEACALKFFQNSPIDLKWC